MARTVEPPRRGPQPARTRRLLLLAACGSPCLPALQTRLMDVAGDPPSLAAAGDHAALSVLGLAVLTVSAVLQRRSAGCPQVVLPGR